MKMEGMYLALFALIVCCAGEVEIYSDASACVGDDCVSEKPVIQLGGLFPVHKNEDGRCGQILDLGVQRLEAMVYAIQLINRSPQLLPNVKVMFEIRDTCVEPNFALEGSLRFVRNRGSHNITFSGISGVVGAASSGISIVVANLLRLFQVPQISYASTAKILSDKSRFDYFFRTVPPDSLQARAMADIIQYYNWTFIHAIYSNDAYGSEGIQAFFEEIRPYNHICVASTTGIPPGVTTESVFDSAVMQLDNDWVGNSSVIVLFGQLSTATGVLTAVKKMDSIQPGFAERFTWIGSDAWGDQLPSEFHSVAHGLLGVSPKASTSDGFDSYFQSLNPNTYTSNPWFNEYWELVFNCTFDEGATDNLKLCDPSRQSISPENGYRQNSKVTFTIDAVFAFAHAIHNLISIRCPNNDLCPEVVDSRSGGVAIKGELLLEQLRNVSFPGMSGGLIQFDSSGDEQGDFVIRNLKKVPGSSSEFYYDIVGSWSPIFDLDFFNSVEWNDDDIEDVPESVCSLPCGFGEFPDPIPGQSSCCWLCAPCPGMNLVSEGVQCEECALGFKPTDDRMKCVEIIPSFLKWYDPWALFLLFCTTMGLITTFMVTVLFIKYRNHPVIKASGRELSSMVLIGLFCSYSTPLFYLSEPSVPICIFRRFSVGVAFSICYSALLVKTNRIYRIFKNAENSLNPPNLISPQSQVAFTLLLVCVQIVVAVVWLTVERPSVKVQYSGTEGEKVCGASNIFSYFMVVLYNLILLVTSTVFGLKARNAPQEFNDSKFINITLLSTILVWIGLAPAYFTTGIVVGDTYQSISLLLAIFCGATIMLVFLFLVKIYQVYQEKRRSERDGDPDYVRERANSLASFNNTNCISMRSLSLSTSPRRTSLHHGVGGSNATIGMASCCSSPNRPTTLLPSGMAQTNNAYLSGLSPTSGTPVRPTSLLPPGRAQASVSTMSSPAGSPNQLYPPSTLRATRSAASSPLCKGATQPPFAIPTIAIEHVTDPGGATTTPYPSPTGSGGSFPSRLPSPTLSDVATQTMLEEGGEDKIDDDDIMAPDSTSSLDAVRAKVKSRVALAPPHIIHIESTDDEDDEMPGDNADETDGDAVSAKNDVIDEAHDDSADIDDAKTDAAAAAAGDDGNTSAVCASDPEPATSAPTTPLPELDSLTISATDASSPTHSDAGPVAPFPGPGSLTAPTSGTSSPTPSASDASLPGPTSGHVLLTVPATATGSSTLGDSDDTPLPGPAASVQEPAAPPSRSIAGILSGLLASEPELLTILSNDSSSPAKSAADAMPGSTPEPELPAISTTGPSSPTRDSSDVEHP